MERWVTKPNGVYEFLLGYPWPMTWAYGLLVLLVVLGLRFVRRNRNAPAWLVGLPLLWLVCQILAAAESSDHQLAWATVHYFSACAGCFYLGYFALSRVESPWPFWAGLLGGFSLVLVAGWGQHFGGLEETRRYFWAYMYPSMTDIPPEYLKKIASNRIFSTLFYPNALAGALLLLLPPVLARIAGVRRLTPAARGFLIVLFGIAALACLYWSGSKGGWLLMLALGLIVLFQLPFKTGMRTVLLIAVLGAGLAGFFWKYAVFFNKGATSVSARFDYWRAALQTAKAHPLLGTGPGTFAHPYAEIKRPESEMSRLVHNDYLEQASDSGIPAFLAYTLFIGAALFRTFSAPQPRRSCPGSENQTAQQRWQTFSIWLGLLGWALQSLFEFSLYIPALAWPAFTFFGLLLGRNNQSSMDKAPRAG